VSGLRDRRKPAEPASPARRAIVLFGLQGAVIGGLALQMRRLQLDQGEVYRTLAEENRINTRLVPPARGELFDRLGRPLAVNRQNLRVLMIREQAGDVAAALDRLARLAPLSPADRERVMREFQTKSAFVPVVVAEHLDWETFALINANLPALPGVLPEAGLTRWYPEGPAFSHVLGHVGRVSEADIAAEAERSGAVDPLLRLPDFQIGKNGVEKIKEPMLRGAAGAQRVEVNAVGRVIREIDRDGGARGASLTMTLDLDLQRYAMTRMGAESAATVVIEVATGDILVMASAPGFDPNKFVVGVGHEAWKALLEDDHRPLADKTVSGQYPPGSTFKMMVALAALEKGVMTPTETVFCNGGYQLGNRRFHCWKRGGHGSLACHDAIVQSCDVYFYEAARRVGVDAVSEMARRFGLGVRPDLPMTAIREGIMPTRDWKRATRGEGWQAGDTLNVGIGQGFTLATPFQLALMTARLASGVATEARLVRAIDREAAPVAPAPPLAISARDLRLMRESMRDVVNGDRGTARKSRIYDPQNEMAGKTGTSQVRRITMAERARGVIRNEDLPWNRRDHALFVGYAPAHAPRYAIAVVVEHGGGGSAAAAPIARDVMMRALYGPLPPIEAYAPGERDAIRKEREAPPPETGATGDAARRRA
jgi:penicillin-binding protein 2